MWRGATRFANMISFFHGHAENDLTEAPAQSVLKGRNHQGCAHARETWDRGPSIPHLPLVAWPANWDSEVALHCASESLHRPPACYPVKVRLPATHPKKPWIGEPPPERSTVPVSVFSACSDLTEAPAQSVLRGRSHQGCAHTRETWDRGPSLPHLPLVAWPAFWDPEVTLHRASESLHRPQACYPVKVGLPATPQKNLGLESRRRKTARFQFRSSRLGHLCDRSWPRRADIDAGHGTACRR
jgi:hypothetical protein